MNNENPPQDDTTNKVKSVDFQARARMEKQSRDVMIVTGCIFGFMVLSGFAKNQKIIIGNQKIIHDAIIAMHNDQITVREVVRLASEQAKV